MGQSANGILAYGYDLGGSDEWKVRETGEYGALAVLWHDEAGAGDDDWPADFTSSAQRRLLDASGFTETYEDGRDGYFGRERAATKALDVEIKHYCSAGSPMHLLAARVIAVNCGYVVPVDPAWLADRDTLAAYDQKLAAALDALGLTPVQEKPAWLLCSYCD